MTINHLPKQLLAAFGITFFLFFIDEGYYSFRWMRNPGNWIVFFIYVMLFFGSQWFTWRVLLGRYRGKDKLLRSMAFGITIILVVVIGFYNLWKWLKITRC